MKNYLLLLSFFLVAIVSSCKDKETSFVNIKDIKYTSLQIDTVSISIDNSSYGGFSSVGKESIYFLDEYFGYLYSFDIDGNIINRQMGIGRGPDEIPIKNPSAASILNSDLILLGSTYDAYLYRDFTDMQRISIKCPQSSSLKESGTYTSFSEIVRMSGDFFYYNIYSEVSSCNPFKHSRQYFEDAHILMKVNINTGETEPVGGYSEYYKREHNKVNHFFSISYDVDNDANFYISHQADSSVYVYDNEFNLINRFGYTGDNMDTDYTITSPTLSSFNEAYANDIVNKGYYYWIKYIDHNDILFRSYQKGSHSDMDGLQIYERGILVADIEVPKQFKIIGYIHPYYISSIACDEDGENMRFYRFML